MLKRFIAKLDEVQPNSMHSNPWFETYFALPRRQNLVWLEKSQTVEKNSIIFYLSNKTVQINFPSFCALVMPQQKPSDGFFKNVTNLFT